MESVKYFIISSVSFLKLVGKHFLQTHDLFHDLSNSKWSNSEVLN